MTDIVARTPLRTRRASGSWSLLLWGLAGALALRQAIEVIVAILEPLGLPSQAPPMARGRSASCEAA
jgi:hypothetical protein